MTTTQPDRMDADLALVTLFPEGVTTASGSTYQPSTEKFLTAVFRELDREGYGVADGASFRAFTGQEEGATTRLASLLGIDEDTHN